MKLYHSLQAKRKTFNGFKVDIRCDKRFYVFRMNKLSRKSKTTTLE